MYVVILIFKAFVILKKLYNILIFECSLKTDSLKLFKKAFKELTKKFYWF